MRWDIRWAGFGGQGVIRAGEILGRAAVKQGLDSAMRPMYGPEKTGGWSRADVVISDEPIIFPLIVKPDILIAMSQDGMNRDGASLRKGGFLLIDGELVKEIKSSPSKIYSVEATSIADSLGRRIVANIVMLGAFAKAFNIVDPEILLQTIVESFPRAVELNKTAFRLGMEKVEEV
ncbi:MAG: 2-oxoacid:acceptor oxidoreductase family protein [Aigarchaeota archaeon]|nr:2-oxoacid:acceptor oxidoreductase family protein [Aigarchaeota archaeon]MDW7986515.1 2-oxoacid:acceptor oxidoreductase family protein [Nitrososphaerota archaeon]